MKSVLSKSYEEKVKAFGDALKARSLNTVLAGELLVQLVEENENTYEILAARFNVPLQLLESLERLGRGEIVDELFLTSGLPAATRALSEGLSTQDQRRLLNNPVPVAVVRESGIHIELKRMGEITFAEAHRVIRNGEIKSSEDQIKTLKELAANRMAKALRYELTGDGIIFRDNRHKWTWEELDAICQKIRPKAHDIEATIKRNQVVKDSK